MNITLIKKKQYITKKYYGKFTTEQYTKIFIVIIATLEGFMTLASVSYLTLLNTVYTLSASSLQLFSTMRGNVPGLLSVFWGLISDTFPIFGYRSYLLINICIRLRKISTNFFQNMIYGILMRSRDFRLKILRIIRTFVNL